MALGWLQGHAHLGLGVCFHDQGCPPHCLRLGGDVSVYVLQRRRWRWSLFHSPVYASVAQRALYTRLLAELYLDDIVLTIRKQINKYHPEAALRLPDEMLQ